MIKKLLLTLLLVVTTMNVNAARIYVDANATGANNGTSWANAFTTIEDALISSIIGDEIWVKSGVYKPVSASGFIIPSGVKVYGSFAGTETQLSQRDLTANITTLNGDIGSIGIDIDNAEQLVRLSNVNNQTRFDGFRIINGNANSSGAAGGGLYNINGSPTIANCIFISNQTNGDGGAIFSQGGNIIIEDCDINNNTAQGNGGGIFLGTSGTAIIRRTKINRNSTTVLSGGGLATDDGFSTLIMDRCEISGNTAENAGGAIRIGDDTNFNIYNSVLIGNISEFSTIDMDSNNTGTHNIVNCTFSGNNQVNTSSSFSTTVRVSTNTQISNSIFWDNDSFGEIFNMSGFAQPSVNYCVVEGGYATGTGNITTNPNFEIPAIPIFAPFTLDDGYDYALSMSSPAINVGTNSTLSGAFNSDFLGNARVVNTTVDMGAYEYDPTLSTPEINELNNEILLLYNAESKRIDFIYQNDFLNSSSKMNVDIINLSGQTIFSKKNFNENYIDASEIRSGMYIVRFSDNSLNTTIDVKKVIIY
ncbi:MAG: T9SS type A sorting domain-containing protein [Bacteroidota bacterium]